MIAQKGALGIKDPEDETAVFERNKEVDEWLMGSGESDATAASNNSLQQNQLQLAQLAVIKAKQAELEKPV